ncbi:MBL fold metallo-hydrolase [Halobacillus trueperi]|uniref:MBL fold metallo-hydrolase n=1 Tax=Halobacillus trueperi TaxID=156205 RepID=A0A3D8VLW3_9BACI|nr:MBL fold metallo-hydrolase [Halobacillus trueperi]RDY70292.1 MBL fold metallo-hydrolase [Halobacillus trueperi]
MIEVKALASSSKGNCYHITDGKTPLLLEAGIKIKEIQRKLNFQTSKIKACLITHEHNDHSAGVQDMIKSGKDCYMSKGTAEAIGVTGNRVKQVGAREAFTVGTWTVMPFEVEHDVSEPLGFLLANEDGDKLLFATDTYYIRYKFKGLTHILCECNYSLDILNKNIADGRIPKVMKKRLLRSHFSLENVKEFLKANDLQRVREIWLLHLSDNNSDEIRFKDEIEALTGKPVHVP